MTAPLTSLRVNARALTILLIIALPAFVLAGVIAVGIGQAQLRDSYGQLLGRMAEQTAAATDSFVFRHLTEVSTLARVPVLRAASTTASGETPDGEQVLDIDRRWQQLVSLPIEVAALLENPASRFLREAAGDDPVYRELLLTDRHGRLVAASGRTTDYYQGDERWWGDVATRGRVSVADVAWDDSAGVFALEVAVPVTESSGRLVGVLKAVVDTRALFAAVTGVSGGGTGERALVRRDGSVVFSRASVDPSTQYFAANLVRDHLQSTRPGDLGDRTYFRATTSAGQPRIVALAPSQLARSFPELPWAVAVSESEASLFAPIQAQIRHLLLAFASVAALFAIALLWWSFRLAMPVDPDLEQMELHLGAQHPHVSGVGETDISEAA